MYEIFIEGLWTGVSTTACFIARPNGVSSFVYAGFVEQSYYDAAAGWSQASWQTVFPSPSGLILALTNWNLGGYLNVRALWTPRVISGAQGRPIQSTWSIRSLNASRQDQSNSKSAGYWSENVTNLTSMSFHLTQGSFDGSIIMRTVD
jgi:hypothetical protein